MFLKSSPNNKILEYEIKIQEMIHNKDNCMVFIHNQKANLDIILSLLSKFILSENKSIKMKSYQLLLEMEKKNIITTDIICSFLCKDKDLESLVKMNQIRTFLKRHIKEIFVHTNTIGKLDKTFKHSVFFENYYNEFFSKELFSFVRKMNVNQVSLTVNKDFFTHNDRIFKELKFVFDISSHKDIIKFKKTIEEYLKQLEATNVFDLNISYTEGEECLMVIEKKYDFFILTDKILNDFYLFKSFIYKVKNEIFQT